ncbi:MAG: DUF1128 domain-containing protein [Bacillaceae bacterium]|nr:DUF1128 domain-containing protein [Bacillaceae bacterium]
MDLSKPSRENLAYILNWISQKLKVVNTTILDPEDFTADHYEDLLDIYEMMKKKDKFSISEQEAIVSELGKMRKS